MRLHRARAGQIGKKLIAGLRLLWGHPALAARDCGDCETWWYEGLDTEKVAVRCGKKLKRPAGCPPPCHACPKVPEEVREALRTRERVRRITKADAVELSGENVRVWLHYCRMKGVAWQAPDARDPIVQRHAGIIRCLEDGRDRAHASGQADALLAVLGGAARAREG